MIHIHMQHSLASIPDPYKLCTMKSYDGSESSAAIQSIMTYKRNSKI